MMAHQRSARERIASNEAFFRQINESVEWDYSATDYPGLIGFLCECGHAECSDTVELSRREYERVRRSPRRFAIVAGHEIPGVEDVVERHERYAVLEKRGDVTDLVERTDPRR
jgi:hypothetical protein